MLQIQNFCRNKFLFHPRPLLAKWIYAIYACKCTGQLSVSRNEMRAFAKTLAIVIVRFGKREKLSTIRDPIICDSKVSCHCLLLSFMHKFCPLS